MRNSSFKKIMAIAMGIFLVGTLIAMGVLFYFEKRRAHDATAEGEIQRTQEENYIIFEGEKYVYNSDIMNILFMGIDKTGQVEIQDMPGGGGQADSILLITANKKEETMQILQISRDTMIGVDIYDSDGEYYTTVDSQVNLQYAYGNGEERSCWLMKKKISELLYEIPIHAYASMNISGIVPLNDSLGGVKLTVPEDYTDIHPDFEKGAEVTLRGPQAESYVRSRDTQVSGSNEQRMERQKQYVTAFMGQFQDMLSADDKIAEKMYKEVKPYLVSDLTLNELETVVSCTLAEGGVIKVPGTVVQGDIYDEFHVDDEALYRMLIKMFYKKVES